MVGALEVAIISGYWARLKRRTQYGERADPTVRKRFP